MIMMMIMLTRMIITVPTKIKQLITIIPIMIKMILMMAIKSIERTKTVRAVKVIITTHNRIQKKILK